MGDFMRFCELREKEVINCRDCVRLGFVCDIEFDVCTGMITHIIVPGPCKIWGLFGRDHEYVISRSHICQIGVDIILVDVDLEKCLVKLG
ncbi:YlmC/YmxH family sporulation protein [Anaerotaenia torta]|uniref:PRC-barrel domain-containing protein n=1 Tax=Anaerotaenia torta TaxID=433293 RepID=UPI003D1C5F9B